MKSLVYVLVTFLVATGCAWRKPTSPSPSSLEQKRQEIEALVVEIDQLTRSFATLQEQLSPARSEQLGDLRKEFRARYPVEAQQHDFDYAITVLRRARNALAAQQKQLRARFGIGHGPF